MPNKQARKPLELKISTVVAVAALLGDTDQAKLSASLAKITGGTPDYFEDEFTLLDLSSLAPEPEPGSIDWPALIALFRSHRLNPVAVRNPPAALEDELRALGLAIDRMEQPRTIETTPAAEHPAPATAEAAAVPTAVPAASGDAAVSPEAPAAAPAANAMVIDTPVRSGQRVYARGTDLIVMAIVNPGAEVIADGSIHVYAPLRGRALAGASGNAGARIFSLAMGAELVSIAGVYRTFDEGWPKDLSEQPVQVLLHHEKLETRAIPLK
jgi:septum site-determining protein MinC